MIKKLLLMMVLTASISLSIAQDSQKIALSTYVAENCGVPTNASKVLENKLTQIVAKSGFAGEPNQRFILTAKVDIVTEDVTATAPPMFAYNLTYTLFIGDGISGVLFASTSVDAKGVGKSKDQAYTQALKALNVNDPALKAFVQEGKQKIIDYYMMNGDAILKRAKTLSDNQQFDEAMWELSPIPEACTKYYNLANDLMVEIYQKQIEQEGQKMLAEAKAVWSAGLNRDAAEQAGTLLAKINPQTSSYAGAQTLTAEIAKRVKELDAREWAFTLQKHKDDTDIKKAQLDAAKEVSIAWAKNQPKTVYRFSWWY